MLPTQVLIVDVDLDHLAEQCLSGFFTMKFLPLFPSLLLQEVTVQPALSECGEPFEEEVTPCNISNSSALEICLCPSNSLFVQPFIYIAVGA